MILAVAAMEEVVAPVFHKYVLPPDAVSVAACPAQTVILPETVAEGMGETKTVTNAISEQEPKETITE